MKKAVLLFYCLFLSFVVFAEDGYQLWLRYYLIDNKNLLEQYRAAITGIQINGNTPGLEAAKEEIITGLSGLLGKKIPLQKEFTTGTLLIGTPASSNQIKSLSLPQLQKTGDEGFSITTLKRNGKNIIAIAANTDAGVLYGVFHFLRLLQTHQGIQNLSIVSVPKVRNRILNHWDNLDRTVERGYAGFSIWDWHKLPDYIDPRYKDYARANASIGINGTVLTNVNANALVLTPQYLEKVAALASIFRPYGIKVYLTARFSAPVEIGGLKTADPLDHQVQQWWKDKAKEIYQYIPDFGGFLVKANSEGQPGPQNYGRNHAEGANMLADALAPYKGIVMWRAFVYSGETPEDRFKQAYSEFKPLDGKFRPNVMVQVKNGPIDFQPREPFHPLFGAMPQTPLMMEFQLTQEYLGQGTNLVYEAPMFKEVLDADTYAKGKGSTVANVIDGRLDGHTLTGMAAVSNIGTDRNWTGHLFGQANWYALGRLAWDHTLTSEKIADEWVRQTFSNNTTLLNSIKSIMLSSHEAMVNYMTPLGLHHIMGYSHHYGPAPWWDKAPRADWNPVYFHKADSLGIGFDRTSKGSNALAQYTPEVRKRFEDISTCPEEYLLWFHHVSWKYKMKSGRTLWEEMCYKYNEGVKAVRAMQAQWAGMEKAIDKERFEHVKMLLNIQEKEAVWWRDACLLYFQTFSKMPIPAQYEQPAHTLEYYESLKFPNAPGI
ncbi:alpha-glucuronidase [Chitinophagaceae bacterium LB-8]|uniref:Xylan alpha-1,2-glucuronidase n=1 Tax=Paraflavisolibacter caeni TaxID=2982496 RepID=A0A9X2XWS4_9BACT|nr:alpha-glucuronidase family glycosyl hydrolase [Paraflavisolibacter caeni]MCU7550141.1 alpha-glucuronidase [Paraflavisolibacter caeni]